MDTWIDVTYPIKVGMPHWPGQPPVSLARLNDMNEGDSANVSVLELSLHTGSHMDAPLHFLRGAQDITHAPLEAMFGEVKVAHIPDAEMVTKEEVERFETRLGEVRGGHLFFKTDNSARNWLDEPFFEDYVAVAPDAAEYLADKGVTLVGVDYLSVAPFNNTVDTHRILLGAGVWVIEGLDLRGVDEGRYEMAALPLKISGGEAAPTRVLIRKLETYRQ